VIVPLIEKSVLLSGCGVKLGLSQGPRGKALGVTFQQVSRQKCCRVDTHPGFCRILEISPNELFGASATVNSAVSQFGTWGMKTALELQELSPASRQAIDGLLVALPKRRDPALRRPSRARGQLGMTVVTDR
jgi:hypothetical protein